MPGLSIVYGTDLIKESLSSLEHHSNIIVRKDILGKETFVVRSGFEGYPFFKYTNNHFSAFIEGIIYNLPDNEIKDGISKIASSYLEKLDYKNEINKFVSNCSGEFIVFIHFAQNENCLLFNDQWGRLPFFWSKQDNNLILSREIKFILHYIPKIHYDKIALLEHLVLRYSLGNRTIFQDISRLLPGHLITQKGNRFDIEEVVHLNYELLCLKKRSRKHYAEKASNILHSSTRNGLSKLQCFNSKVVDISGGYDSRAVLAVVSQIDKNVIPLTKDSITGDESSIAILVAKTCRLKTLLIKPNHDFSSSTMQEILYKTDGFLNGRYATSLYQVAEELVKKLKKPIAEFKGFGGEFLRHPLKTRVYYKNMCDVIYAAVFSNTLIDSVCQCLGLKEKEVKSFWQNFFSSSYKEEKIEDKVMHYYFDYYNLYIGKVEDQHRIHLWPVNPMMSLEWLRFSTTEIPRSQIDYKLFEEILFTISPQIAVNEIPIWDKKSHTQKILDLIENHRTIQRMLVFPKRIQELKRIVQKRRWKKIAETDSRRKTLIAEIEKLYQNTRTIRDNFDRKSIIQFYQTEFGPNNLSLQLLHSIFLYMNKIEATFSEQM